VAEFGQPPSKECPSSSVALQCRQNRAAMSMLASWMLDDVGQLDMLEITIPIFITLSFLYFPLMKATIHLGCTIGFMMTKTEFSHVKIVLTLFCSTTTKIPLQKCNNLQL
jgi:hypothetical protein